MEHALAYGLTGALLCVGYGKPRDRLLLWIGLAACSALLELLQNFVPGRSPAVIELSRQHCWPDGWFYCRGCA